MLCAETYPFVMRPLPYEYDALMPVIDEETLHFHHDKHYKTYIDNLNSALADYPELQKKSLKELLTHIDKLPAQLQTPIRNNGGGVYNHELYFDGMKSPVGQAPEGELAEAIERDFGSYKQWKGVGTLKTIQAISDRWGFCHQSLYMRNGTPALTLQSVLENRCTALMPFSS